MEHFYTIQGEGMHSGKAAYFIRLGGCDVGCVWCDVKDSWDAEKHPKLSVEFLLQQVQNAHAKIVVITGGEPLMHNCEPLTTILQKNGIATHIETSAAHPITGHWNWICVSPKKFKAPIPEVVKLANEIKVVIFNKTDFKWAETHAEMAAENCKLYLQPEWDKATEITPLMIDYIKQNSQWQLCIQMHKYINVP
jgi:7-carboxy-7-deazaguanine synthase